MRRGGVHTLPHSTGKSYLEVNLKIENIIICLLFCFILFIYSFHSFNSFFYFFILFYDYGYDYLLRVNWSYVNNDSYLL